MLSPFTSQLLYIFSGYPDPALVPDKELKEAAAHLLDEERDLPLHYMGSPRTAVLKKQIQEKPGLPDLSPDRRLTSRAAHRPDSECRGWLTVLESAFLKRPSSGFPYNAAADRAPHPEGGRRLLSAPYQFKNG